MNTKDIYNRLKEITSDYKFIYVISYFMYTDFCGPINLKDGRSMMEKLSYNEAAFLIGMWVKNCSMSSIKSYNVNSIAQEVYELLEKLHHTFLKLPKDILTQRSNNISDMLLNETSMKEAIFYASTGAYDYQYVNKAVEKYKFDKEWIRESKDTTIEKLKEIFLRIKELVNQRINSPGFKSNDTNLIERILNLWKFTPEQLVGKTENIVFIKEFISNLYNKDNSEFKVISDFNEYNVKPIIKLTDQEYFIPLPFFFGESIYESPFYWMLEDKEYRSTALLNRGEVAEEISYKLISKVLNTKNCFKNVFIKANKKETVSEIDILAIYQSNAFIFQVKSKKLTLLSKKGNIDSIKSDFKKAVEDSFEQGLVAKEAIEKKINYDFIVDSENINSKIKNVEKCFIVSILLDPYPALTHKVNLILLYQPPINWTKIKT